MNQDRVKVGIGRFLIGVVLVFNVQCGLAFILSPGSYTSGFELSGVAGEGVVRGMGILFIMWNVPYAVALIAPLRLRSALYEAILMQAIGFAGETLLLLSFPTGHPAIQTTVSRFIIFDGGGLVALMAAAWITRRASTDHWPDRRAFSESRVVSPVDKI